MVEPGPEQPRALGRIDHRHGRPVLDAPTGIEDLELGDERAGKVAAHAIEAHHGRVADEVEEGVGHLHRRPTICQRNDLDADEVRPACHVLVGVELGGQPRAAQLCSYRRRPGAEYRHVSRDPRPDLGDQGRGDLGQRERENVVRPGDQTLRRLIGSDDDEQVHGAMLAQGRALCIEIVEFGLPTTRPCPRQIEQVFG